MQLLISAQSVQVFRLPALQIGPESYQYPAAKTVRFECKVPPLFSLVWYKNGQLLETGKGRVKVNFTTSISKVFLPSIVTYVNIMHDIFSSCHCLQ